MRRINGNGSVKVGSGNGQAWLAHLLVVGALIGLLSGGCKSPDKANIVLRKDKQELEAKLTDLRGQHDAALARLAAYEREAGTVETLPKERLGQLFTVHKIDLGQLTGGTDLDIKSPGDEALRVYLVPMDETGEYLKATGHVVVEAFDLSRASDNRIGRWEFGPEQLKGAWRSFLRLNAFVLNCPWQTAPERAGLAVKVTFTDALTGRVFERLKDVQVKVPTTRPATRPATQPQQAVSK